MRRERLGSGESEDTTGSHCRRIPVNYSRWWLCEEINLVQLCPIVSADLGQSASGGTYSGILGTRSERKIA